MTKKGKGGPGDTEVLKNEQPLQAVLLADSFTDNFRPLSLDQPKMLSPLNNVTLLDYSVDFLAGSGVEELFVVCTSDKVEEYILQHHTTAHCMPQRMAIHIVKDYSITNAGDALREIDKRQLVQSDPFILMFGDIVTNVNVKDALKAHKERRKKDSSAIMTLLMEQVGASRENFHAGVRCNTEDLIVGLDPTQDNRLVVYDYHSFNKNVAVPCSFFAAHPQVDLRCDLLDCGIDICSPDVLARMADEFDYRDIRREFVANSVAEEEEGLQQKIYCHLLKPMEYAARVHDFYTYAAISKDLLRRCCHPIVPDNLPSGYEKQYRYTLQRHYLYQECKNGKTLVGRSSKVQGPGMIGSSCHIGEDCHVEGTVIGSYCRIENNATILGSHLWDAVHVESGVTVIKSILADGCVIKSGAMVNEGCIIGPGCIVGSGVDLPAFTRLTLAAAEDDGDFDDDWADDDIHDEKSGGEQSNTSEKVEGVNSENSVVGPDGKGRVWVISADDEDDDSFDGLPPTELLRAQSIAFDPNMLLRERSNYQKEQDDDFSDDDGLQIDDAYGEYSDGPVVFGNDTHSPEPAIIGRQKGVDVIEELKMICLEYESTAPIENLAIELNSFKFSQNATYSDCTTAATLSILERMNIQKGMSNGKLVSDFKVLLEQWAPLLQKMSIGLDEEKAIVKALEQSATSGGEIGAVLSSGMSFRFLLQTLHDEEIVSEDAILSWAADHRDSKEQGSEASKLFATKPVQDFLVWLEEDSDEEGDSEEE
jgi:translation initiation factor eIF-2B subunit epsilon